MRARDVDLKEHIMQIVNVVKQQTASHFGTELAEKRRYKLKDIIELWRNEPKDALESLSSSLDVQFHRAFLNWSETMIESLKKIKKQHSWFDLMPIAKMLVTMKLK